MNATIETKKFKEYVGLHALIASILTIILFCLDENAFSFEWMSSWGNWVVYIIYVFGIFAGQILIQHFMLRSLDNTVHRIFLSGIAGGTLGFFAVASFFILLHILSQTT